MITSNQCIDSKFGLLDHTSMNQEGFTHRLIPIVAIFLIILGFVIFKLRTNASIPFLRSPQIIRSSILNLTFNTPNGVQSSYVINYGSPATIETITFKQGYQMIITITQNLDGSFCHNQFNETNLRGENILLAGKINLFFPNNDRDWRKGWVGNTAYQYLPDKKTCISVYREENGSVEKIFNQILATAKFE